MTTLANLDLIILNGVDQFGMAMEDRPSSPNFVLYYDVYDVSEDDDYACDAVDDAATHLSIWDYRVIYMILC